ncbi:uncharacterized protein LOC129715916 isoform X2 [Leucoraja erinacea]|uniref:uncharacterized protein LOC129715916 isoform X2 n=1 Tax=Leucoraja erinaceus TaxID=7782 RepID=UPI002458449B|nr:uncharacterized protein LOC129715916 isoform X2 [Leucoraja erinacea]
MEMDSGSPVPPQSPVSSPTPSQTSASTASPVGMMDDVQLLDLSAFDPDCDQSYYDRIREIFVEVGINISPTAATLPPESDINKRIHNYRLHVAKTWMPDTKYKQIENKFDLYQHELVLLAQQEQRSKFRPEMTADEKKQIEMPINRKLASDLQRLAMKKLDLVLMWVPPTTRGNLDQDSTILREEIIRENELAKAEASSSAAEMTKEERELEEKIMMHKLHVAEAWMPRELLETLNAKFLLFQTNASREEMEKAAADIRTGMSADERRIQAMIRHQQMTLRVQQAHLNRLQVAESWIPEEQRLKIENEYTMMRAIHWRRKSNKPMPAAWVQKNVIPNAWKKTTSPEGSLFGAPEDEDTDSLLLDHELQKFEELEAEQERLAKEEKEFLRRRNEMLASELGVAGSVNMEQTEEEFRLAREEQEFLELEMKVAEDFEKEFFQLEEQRVMRNVRKNEEDAERAKVIAATAAVGAEAARALSPGGAALPICSDASLADKQLALQELHLQLEKLQKGELSEEDKERLLEEERLLKEEMQKGRDRKGTCRILLPPTETAMEAAAGATAGAAAGAAALPPGVAKPCPMKRRLRPTGRIPGWMDTHQTVSTCSRPPKSAFLAGLAPPPTVAEPSVRTGAIPKIKRPQPSRPASVARPTAGPPRTSPTIPRRQQPQRSQTPATDTPGVCPMRGSPIPSWQQPSQLAQPRSYTGGARPRSIPTPARRPTGLDTSRSERRNPDPKPSKLPQRKRP